MFYFADSFIKKGFFPLIFKRQLIQAFIATIFFVNVIMSQATQDQVNGNLIQFNDNGAWCWYQDERAVVDVVGQKLIVGSDASSAGVGGSPRSGDIDAVVFDLVTRKFNLNVLKEGDPIFYCDDHNAPAFLVRPDGKYISMYAAHFGDTSSYYRIFDNGVWGSENEFDWTIQRPGGANFQTTYSNLFYLLAENRTYNFVRGNNKSPNSMISDDFGETWYYGGQLTHGSNIGYNNGYYKYVSNGYNRIDFIFTEYHPRDYNTSIFHGYMQDGKSYTSDGILVDNNIFETDTIPVPADFTTVFKAGTVIGEMIMNRCWNADVQSYHDTVAALITARIDDNTQGNDYSIDPDHAFIYCRFNGSTWSYTYLGQAGKKMYSSEADYTGLGALHPNDPNIIYISTHVDPRTDEDITYREIFKGVTDDNGNSWTWTPVTQNSNQHNFRPIIPLWDEDHTALLWFRGIYDRAQDFNSAIVGIIDNSSEHLTKQIYTDADADNTTFADGSTLSTTGPDANQGADDDQWHMRTGWGNGGSVLTSAEIGGEDAPVLKTEITVSDTGKFDIWVNFWANPQADWRIKAGLSLDNMQIFRQMASKQVEDGDHQTTLILTGSGDTYLYQAYLGRVHLTDNHIIDVYVDDHSIETGSSSKRIGNTARTWYDGISYASLDTNYSVNDIENVEIPEVIVLFQNYPNPFNPKTVISWQLAVGSHVELSIYNILGQKVATLVSAKQAAGKHQIEWNAEGFTSGNYFYRLKSDDKIIKIRKMTLIR